MSLKHLLVPVIFDEDTAALVKTTKPTFHLSVVWPWLCIPDYESSPDRPEYVVLDEAQEFVAPDVNVGRHSETLVNIYHNYRCSDYGYSELQRAGFVRAYIPELTRGEAALIAFPSAVGHLAFYMKGDLARSYFLGNGTDSIRHALNQLLPAVRADGDPQLKDADQNTRDLHQLFQIVDDVIASEDILNNVPLK